MNKATRAGCVDMMRWTADVRNMTRSACVAGGWREICMACV